MSAADLRIDLSTWASTNQDVLKAIGTFLVWLLIAFVVDRWFASRGRKLADKVIKGGISQQADTRLRFVRRLVWLAILAIGVLLALTQFAGFNRVAASLLASGALAAAIIGFAARQTLANLVAGIMLAITQPLRVGDWVTFEDNYGQVEDVRLNYTILRTLSETRIVVPNERLAGGILRNDTLESDVVGVEVSIWLAPGADIAQALDGLRAEVPRATIAEITAEGIRIAIGGERVPPHDRARAESDLRERALRRLHAAGVPGTD
jgi:small-conductance mechanosensitive channel